MAQDTLVTGSKLTAIANAIRTRGGTQAQLTLDQMPQAVADIPGGGGGFDWSQIKGGIKFSNAATQTALDLRGMDTSTFTTMESMFSNCSYLTSVNMSGLDTGAVTTMSSMFSGCSGLTSIDITDLDTSAVKDMYSMFAGCRSMTSLDVSGFDTHLVTTMGYMFNNCQQLTSLDLWNFDTAAVTNMYSMFASCSHLTSLNFSNIDTSALSSMNNMFQYDYRLTDVIWSQNTSQVQPLPTAPTSSTIPYMLKFYVPDSLVNDYKAATNWSTIASQIYPISDLPASVAALYAGHY